MDREKLKALLLKHEGMKLKVYDDKSGNEIAPNMFISGHPTIGVGRALDVNGISEPEALYLLSNDIARVVSYCRETYAWFNELDDTRQNVICSLVFNMGAAKFADFKKTIAYMESKQYDLAANELLCSKWSAQVGGRAVELANMLRDGDIIH